VIEAARIDADRRGRATARFGRSARAEEVFSDVIDGIRSKFSVGYMIHEVVLESRDDASETYRVTDWEPYEISLVAIPADATASVGRSLHQPTETTTMPDTATDERVEERTVAPETAELETLTAAPALPVNPEAEAIRAVGRHFRELEAAEDHIALGGTLEQFRAYVRARRPADPVPVAPRIEARVPYHGGTLRSFRPELYEHGRRQAEENAYRAGQYLRATMFADDSAARWCRDHGVELAIAGGDFRATRVLTGLAAGQSVVVPEELALPIINLREQYGVMRRLAYVHPMSTDTTTVPRRIGGVTAYFVGREAAPTAGDPTLDNVSLTARNIAAETRISNDYADDSLINLADFVAQEMALAFATKEDTCAIDGDGTSTYGGIVGLRTLLAASGSLAGAVDAASGHDTFLEITSPDLDGVVGALPDFPGLNPVWLTSKRGEALMFGRLRTAAGGSKRDMAERVQRAWDGDPIEICQAMPKGTGTTDYSDVVMALYGDFRQGVIFGDRRGMTLLTDPYSLSSYQQTKIVASERFDIVCHGVGDTSNAGPIVALVGE
jgi:HK97 family phage major capsid protein